MPLILQISFMSGLMGDESHICFFIWSIVICCLGWSIWRRFSLAEIYSWKKEGYINRLCRELPRVIHDALPNFIGCSSLKVQPRSLTTKFLHSVTWTSMGHLALWMSLWLTYDFIKALIGHLEILVHWLISDSTSGHITLYNIKKIMFISIIARKSLYYRMLLSIVVNTCYPKILIFDWQLMFYHWTQILSGVFLQLVGLLLLFSRKCLPASQACITIICLPFFQIKIVRDGEKKSG